MDAIKSIHKTWDEFLAATTNSAEKIYGLDMSTIFMDYKRQFQTHTGVMSLEKDAGSEQRSHRPLSKTHFGMPIAQHLASCPHYYIIAPLFYPTNQATAL